MTPGRRSAAKWERRLERWRVHHPRLNAAIATLPRSVVEGTPADRMDALSAELGERGPEAERRIRRVVEGLGWRPVLWG